MILWKRDKYIKHQILHMKQT